MDGRRLIDLHLNGGTYNLGHRTRSDRCGASGNGADRAEANMVFQLVSRRYECGSMSITSYKSFAEWGGVLATTFSSPRSSTGSCTTATSSRSTAPPATGSKTRINLVAGGEPMP